jgi:hypothetical protein
MAVGSLALNGPTHHATTPDVSLEIAPYTLEVSPKHHIRIVAGQSRSTSATRQIRPIHSRTESVAPIWRFGAWKSMKAET